MNWTQLTTATLDEILAWAEEQPWCEAMKTCQQDSEWHAEGDVWTHTQMVCRELTKLEDWPSLEPIQQSILIFTALFHDCAKPITSEVDPATGRVRSPNHSRKGARIARNVLRDLTCDLETRELIALLVRVHGRPAFLAQRNDPAHEVVRCSWLVINRLLYLFALADTRGRVTESLSRPEENLQYWKLQSEELGCFEQCFPFASDHARFVYFRSTEPNLYYVPHDEFSCTVTMMSGLPGSGKDTWLTRYRADLPVVALDELRDELDVDPTENQGRVAQLAQQRCRELLRNKTSFAFNATNIMQLTRRRWVELFADYNARIEQVYLEPPLEEILKHNASREDPVPEGVIRKLAACCEPPTRIESHQVLMVG